MILGRCPKLPANPVNGLPHAQMPLKTPVTVTPTTTSYTVPTWSNTPKNSCYSAIGDELPQRHIRCERLLFINHEMETYYEHYKDFGDRHHVCSESMPSDVKRLLSHGKHTFRTRDYFFSPSERLFYKFNPIYEDYFRLKPRKQGNSILFSVRTDDKKSTTICVSDRFLERTQSMNAIDISSMRSS